MKIDLPGLLEERLPSGNVRYRVRVAGNKSRRIVLPVRPEHKDFLEYYHAARVGIVLKKAIAPQEKAVRGSITWLTFLFEEHMARLVESGQMSPKTIKQRQYFLRELREKFGEYDLEMPQESMIEYLDTISAHSTSKHDNTLSALKAMYKWACERGHARVNPCQGITRVHKYKGGATPWTVEDFEKYKAAHPEGSMQRLALILFICTACRVGDAVLLGRAHEVKKYGVRWLEWKPQKKGASDVSIPMLQPLQDALNRRSVIGETYLLTQYGRPFASSDSFRNKFKGWCVQAGLPDRSPHGIRKAAGHLLAQAGATQYQIMAIHGHSEAKTSEVYTKGIKRDQLAMDAMALLGGLKL